MEELNPPSLSSSTCFVWLTYQVLFAPWSSGLDLDTDTLERQEGSEMGWLNRWRRACQLRRHTVIDNRRLNKQRGTPSQDLEILITHAAWPPSTRWQSLEKATSRLCHHDERKSWGKGSNFQVLPKESDISALLWSQWGLSIRNNSLQQNQRQKGNI